MSAKVDHDCNRTREQLDDSVSIISTALDSARPQPESLLSLLVPQITAVTDRSSLGVIFIPPSALIQKVVSFQP